MGRDGWAAAAMDGWAAAVDSLDSPSAADRPIARRRGAIIRRRTSIIRRRTSIIRRRTSIIRRRTSLARRRRTSIIREALLEGAHRLRRFREALARLCARLRMDRRPACRIPHVARFDALGSSVLRVHGEYRRGTAERGGPSRYNVEELSRSLEKERREKDALVQAARNVQRTAHARATRSTRRATCNPCGIPPCARNENGSGENAAAPPGRLPRRRTCTRTHGNRLAF
jgi:hypothetical protein